ncbi:MAG: amidohydrolase family protein [Planctomycetota bacterium]
MQQLILALALVGAFTTLHAEGEDSKHAFEFEAHREHAPGSGNILIRGATVHSAVAPARLADVLVLEGRIVAIGSDLQAAPNVTVIDGAGKHLAPGVVDTHSHMAIERGINESSLSITADCDISDVINADDPTIYRALAGGVTTIQCLHGSANAIGGQSEVLKLRWRVTADELRFEGAPRGVKFALGENPKRSNGGRRSSRFPATRMGIESLFARAFARAEEYDADWTRYREAVQRGEDPAPPRRDVRLDALSGILDGSILVHSHCYRQDEILMLLRMAEQFGFQIRTLQHVLEGYKVAWEILEHGAMTSTFSDWWAYKVEAYDAVPQNAAFLDSVGVVSTINSDDDEMVRRLYHEAAKSIRYADMDPVAALRLVTLNGAKQLGVDDRVGSIEVGKDADLVLLDGPPLSVFAKVLTTFVDGKVEFQRRDAFGFDDEPLAARSIQEAEKASMLFDPTRPSVALVGATIHTATDGTLRDALLVVQDGRIAELGTDLAVPELAEVVELHGKHLWPGMIALNTSLGLREIGAVRSTIDVGEIGGNQPDLRVTAALHPDSAHIPVTRTDGVTRAQSAPSGRGPMLGQSAVIRLTGDTWEEMVVVDRDALHVRFPTLSNRAEDPAESGDIKVLKKLLEEARQYRRRVDESLASGLRAPAFDPRLDALAPYALGERPVALHADNAQTILLALKFQEEEQLDAVLYGGREAWKVADRLAEVDMPVVLGPIQSSPTSTLDPYDSSFAAPAVLHRAGVRFCIQANDEENTRHLPFNAGIAVAFGLPEEEALRAVTYYPAEILGLEDDLGSLRVGKIADLVATEGHLLEPGGRVTHVWIDGRPQDVGNRQTELWRRYEERFGRMRDSQTETR